MNPTAMSVILAVTLSAFAWSASRRWRLLGVTQPDPRIELDRGALVKRLRNLLVIGALQKKMPANERYRIEGLAHIAIFAAFFVLLLNSVLLWGRGYNASFDFWGLFAEDTVAWRLYSIAKELIAALCVLGASVFVYDRIVRRLRRMSLGPEGLVILGIIITMMLADFLYVGARRALLDHADGGVTWMWWEPVGSALSFPLAGLSRGTLTGLEHLGFWWHASWVLIFLNLLPYSKHFHILTALPNVFFQPIEPPGKLPDLDDIEGKIERDEPVGVQKIEQLTWKQALDLYTCTECGRCSDNCPAFTTGKKLSPKHFTMALRDHLYDLEGHFLAHRTPEHPNHERAAHVP